ncbi:SDR family oxidoreductase [Amycolatopsis sp. QT-25]|uniref:SDR family NAD(P)-dependent oxidoreductase n=1 Tax=Amycolatopsis sp. QT-25 TaxID=3034022 RepID=UPI0023EC8066|nr:SDR family oxidoreductase [Amycolatopsis sp. QT-25]WET83070.1 SDR family oxidoreductase [Amycolatopsis sp. QT-25]
MEDPKRLLAGKTALVTGAGRGIGAATARALGRHGASVAVNYHSNVDTADQVVSDIKETGAQAIAVQGDARVPKDVRALVKRTVRELGEIDILVCNVIGDTRNLSSKVGRSVPSFIDSDKGVAGLRGAVLSQLDATLTCCRQVVPGMRRLGGGSIIFIGASVTHNSAPAPAEIAVAKSAQDSVARLLAQQLGPDGIRVNNVAPGFVPTDANAGPHQQTIIEHIAIQTPLQPIIRAEDVANTVVALVGDLTERLTGLFVPVDGGVTLV